MRVPLPPLAAILDEEIALARSPGRIQRMPDRGLDLCRRALTAGQVPIQREKIPRLPHDGRRTAAYRARFSMLPALGDGHETGLQVTGDGNLDLGGLAAEGISSSAALHM